MVDNEGLGWAGERAKESSAAGHGQLCGGRRSRCGIFQPPSVLLCPPAVLQAGTTLPQQQMRLWHSQPPSLAVSVCWQVWSAGGLGAGTTCEQPHSTNVGSINTFFAGKLILTEALQRYGLNPGMSNSNSTTLRHNESDEVCVWDCVWDWVLPL